MFELMWNAAVTPVAALPPAVNSRACWHPHTLQHPHPATLA
jgi:hypothetical protein